MVHLKPQTPLPQEKGLKALFFYLLLLERKEFER
jgi:hypothetical protein